MSRGIICFISILLFTTSYSQKVERWKSNGFICEIVEDTSTLAPHKATNCNDSLRVGFLGDFYKDKVKVIVKNQILVDTILSTREEEGMDEPNNPFLVPIVAIKECYSKNIDFILNKKKYRFSFKKGYSIIYISVYEEIAENDVNQIVYSMTFTNELLKSL